MRPTISISDRDTFLRATEYARGRVRVLRGRAWLMVEREGRWVEVPALRFHYSMDVKTVDGDQTWTFTEVVPLDEEGYITQTTIEQQLASENRPATVMHRSGSL